jgi:hypothetical protein
MSKEEIISQIEKSFSEYKGTNEAIDDAAFYIEYEFNKMRAQILLLKADLLKAEFQTLKNKQ